MQLFECLEHTVLTPGETILVILHLGREVQWIGIGKGVEGPERERCVSAIPAVPCVVFLAHVFTRTNFLQSFSVLFGKFVWLSLARLAALTLAPFFPAASSPSPIYMTRNGEQSLQTCVRDAERQKHYRRFAAPRLGGQTELQ
jgi:hypothetical protein